ncbi:MAG: 2-amino-4-hydroxy-6-hydroxymethyldihydropteridine diphosphokinase [Comamonadaceae bacterium]|nr:MAG: 2-amino-4-hydroxy-6-hydroxymethyldihydropteridine diphosphokinase [Comamonadaceae bacterium]
MRAPVTAFVGLGANLGEPLRALHEALATLGSLPSTRLVRSSRIYRSAPVDAGGPDYLNAVAELETGLAAPELLAQLQRLEQAAGRERPYRNAPRTLDLDLLLYGDGRIESAALTVPHPRMRERAFVLLPLRELAPHLVDAADLAAVAAQRIEALPPTSSPA